MSMSLVCDLEIDLDHHIAVDDHSNDPERACLTLRVDGASFEAVANEDHHEE